MPKDLLEGVLGAPSQGSNQQPKDLLAEAGVAPEPLPGGDRQPPTPDNMRGFAELMFGNPVEDELAATRGAGKIGMGVTVGVEKPFAGLTQVALEGLARAGMTDPKTTEAFTKLQMDFQNATGKDDKLKDAGEVFGTGLSYLLPQGLALKLPGLIVKTAGPLAKALEFFTSTGVGAAEAGTQFHEAGSDKSRLAEAGWGAALSAAGQAAVVPIQRIGTKVLNTAVIQDLVKDIKGLAEGFNMNAGAVVESFKKTFGGRQAALVRAQTRQDLVGDAFHAGGIDTSSVVAALEKAKSEAPKGATGALNDALRLLRSPPIKAGGTIVPPGSPLYKSIMSKGAAAGAAKYSTVRRALDTIDAKIDSSSPEIAAALKEPRKALGDFFDDLTKKGGSDLRRAAREAASRAENLEVMQDPKFRDILRATGPQGDKNTYFEANKKILDIATGADAARAERLYKSLTPEGRQELQKGIAFRALDQSLSEGGTLDPAKFTKFMEENDNVKRFFSTPREKQIAQGMGNVVKEASLAAGKTKPMGGGITIGRGLIGWGVWDLVHGAMKGSTAEAGTAAGKIITGMALLKFSNAFGKSLQRSQRAESFFAAASKVKPGTPDSIRLFNRFMMTFGAAAGAESGSGNIRGNIMEMGLEKLIEPGMDALAQ